MAMTDKDGDEISPISIHEMIEGFERLDGTELSASLVALDKEGAPRYVIGWDLHTSEECVDDIGERFELAAVRIVFKLGDIANV
jgi:hypothetical protein